MKHPWLYQKDLAERLLQNESVTEFLQFFYTHTKQHTPAFSYQWLARESELSKSLIQGIFNGSKKLTMKNLPPILKALTLPKTLEEYFEYLVQRENAKKSPPVSTQQKALKNLRDAHLDTLLETANFDTSISDPDFAILYAALGDQENGATLEEIYSKIQWSEERIRFLLNELLIKKFVRVTPLGRWKGTKKFISTVADNRNGWVSKLFLSTLKRHEQKAQANFFSKDHLSLTYTFCLKDAEFEAMNQELKVMMSSLMKKYHDGEGQKIVSLILGTHKN